MWVRIRCRRCTLHVDTQYAIYAKQKSNPNPRVGKKGGEKRGKLPEGQCLLTVPCTAGTHRRNQSRQSLKTTAHLPSGYRASSPQASYYRSYKNGEIKEIKERDKNEKKLGKKNSVHVAEECGACKRKPRIAYAEESRRN